MTREHKYRAWDKKLKRWANPNDYNISEAPMERAIWSADDGIFYLKSNEDFIWVEYTGLKDKNGVEIWEGDCIELKNGDSTSRGDINEKNYHEMIIEIKRWVDDRDGGSVEVIGNAYEGTEPADTPTK